MYCTTASLRWPEKASCSSWRGRIRTEAWNRTTPTKKKLIRAVGVATLGIFGPFSCSIVASRRPKLNVRSAAKDVFLSFCYFLGSSLARRSWEASTTSLSALLGWALLSLSRHELTHTLAHSRSLKHTPTLKHTLSLSQALSLSHAYTPTLSCWLALSLYHERTHSHSLACKLFHYLMHTLSLLDLYSVSFPNTHILASSLSFSLAH